MNKRIYINSFDCFLPDVFEVDCSKLCILLWSFPCRIQGVFSIISVLQDAFLMKWFLDSKWSSDELEVPWLDSMFAVFILSVFCIWSNAELPSFLLSESRSKLKWISSLSPNVVAECSNDVNCFSFKWGLSLPLDRYCLIADRRDLEVDFKYFLFDPPMTCLSIQVTSINLRQIDILSVRLLELLFSSTQLSAWIHLPVLFEQGWLQYLEPNSKVTIDDNKQAKSNDEYVMVCIKNVPLFIFSQFRYLVKILIPIVLLCWTI